ncbi:beta-galactosidase [Metabacillus malikii]|uniref:Beta-galactosidase n=1 Tax=Metabacillus malikii TaxID=1504265 RepID=A0ABT9ZCC8_9BACI|nr:beta-galactosidase [Metabacillus malikii]MDQ0229579.1 beta-galactosidase [Metabacillus malikii]
MNKLYHGAAYYPELWDRDTIEEDIIYMKKAGINVVRMGEFAWSTMEPTEGSIDVGFFEEMIVKLASHGIETVFCTPTPTPPIWYSYGYPERMHVDKNGRTMGHGSRQHACTNHPIFREKAALITEELAKRLGKLPGLIGWQIDNEFKCHVSECMCEQCKSLWHDWLKEKYGTIDNLNNKWGTQIWSEAYLAFEQVPQPGPTPFLHHSSLSTMYRLFSMEKIAEFSDEQATIIRKHSNAPITHNSSVAFSVDNERLFENLDFASFDTYATIENYPAYLFNHDLFRNIKSGKAFWVMETSTSYAASLASYAMPHPDGYLQAEAIASYALGAQGFCYWLWRQQKSGCEQPHSSVLSAWGKPTIGFENVLEVEEIRKKIEPIIAETYVPQAELAITYSDRAKAFLETEPHQNLQHRRLMTAFYERILHMGISRDLITEQTSLDGYKLLFTPFLPAISHDYLMRAKAFVEAGGIWIVGPLSGGRTEEHTIHTDMALGELERLIGANVLFTFPMNENEAVGSAFDVSAPLSLWSSVFEYDSKTSVGIITEGIAKGHSFLSEYRLGKGKVVMLGSMPIGQAGDTLLTKLIEHYSKEVQLSTQLSVTKGTIVVPREHEQYTVWFIINMDGQGGSVNIQESATNLITKENIQAGELEIGKFEYVVIRFEKTQQ